MATQRFLVAVHVGPVQDFIAAARRTADLWAGSQLLIHVVNRAAEVFPKKGLIFPHPKREGGANRILAVVDGYPAVIVANAEKAAKKAVADAWSEACSELYSVQKQALDEERAKTQIADFLEFYSAWVPLGDDYADSRRRVEMLLRGRKALRDFEQASLDDAGIPKSPLNPGLSSVGKKDNSAALAGRPLCLKNTETLDAVSILKRVKGITAGVTIWSTRHLADGFSPVAAADSTNAGAKPKAPDSSNEDPDSSEDVAKYPYYAILVGDGDGIGTLLNEKKSIEDHIRIAIDLDAFAKEAKIRIERCGQHVYVGGDDVLALVPVAKAFNLAQDLKTIFSKYLKASFLEDHDREATFSVGVAIVQYRDPLSVSLERARAAERTAKETKDSIVVALHTRGGVPIQLAQRWGDFDLDDWQQLYQDEQLPRGLPYELQELHAECPDDLPGEAIAAEVARILSKKDGATEKGRDAVISALGESPTRADLESLGLRLRIARFLTAPRAEG